MTNLMVAAMVGLFITLFGTPLAIKIFRRRGWGQLIREEGPKAHYEKRGTPTMGGLVILVGTILGYFAAHVNIGDAPDFEPSGMLAMATICALGLLGFIDDFIKIRMDRSLGLQKRAKFIRITNAGLSESHVHDVSITREAPNYPTR